MNLIERIKSFIDRFQGEGGDPHDVAQINAWLSQAKRLFLLKSLKDHDGIKYLLEIFENEVKQINSKLLSSDSARLPDYERDRLLDRRDLAEKYLNLFLTVENDLDELDKTITAEGA